MLFDPDKPWYHGSPKHLTVLRAGSTVTQNRELARVFSHKPAIVIGDESNGRWKHTGPFKQGFLYRLARLVSDSDIEPVPHSSLPPGTEWNTKREYQLELVTETVIFKEELLTRHELIVMAGQGLVDMQTVNTILEKQQLRE
jgi:hypothetical protein